MSFTPHLVPMNRGILSTIYVRGRRGKTAQDLHEILMKPYAKEPSSMCCRSARCRKRRHVRGSNMTFIGVVADRIEGRAIIISALDNMTKGASGQAVQNMNLMLGFAETIGHRSARDVSMREVTAVSLRGVSDLRHSGATRTRRARNP